MTEKRLLAIDDEPEFGDLVRTVAEDLGFVARITADPEEFRELFRSFDPTVVVVDVVMPDTDGIELLRYLADRQCRARVIVISGYSPNYLASAKTIGEAWGLPSVTSLPKPLPIAALRRALTAD